MIGTDRLRLTLTVRKMECYKNRCCLTLGQILAHTRTDVCSHNKRFCLVSGQSTYVVSYNDRYPLTGQT